MIDCGVPPSLLNGKFETPGSTLFGTVVTYTCDGGYSFKDNRDTRTCQSDKMWSNSDLECSEFPHLGSYIQALYIYANFAYSSCSHVINTLLFTNNAT